MPPRIGRPEYAAQNRTPSFLGPLYVTPSFLGPLYLTPSQCSQWRSGLPLPSALCSCIMLAGCINSGGSARGRGSSCTACPRRLTLAAASASPRPLSEALPVACLRLHRAVAEERSHRERSRICSKIRPVRG
jgi:hypothetical protein